MQVNCPHCGGGIENRPDLAGEVVSCPHCRNAVTMPPFAPVATPSISISRRSSVQHRGGRRRSAVDTGFGATWGVLLALMSFVLIVPIVICGGCVMLNVSKHAIEQQNKQSVPPSMQRPERD
jgi:hypothetical protein